MVCAVDVIEHVSQPLAFLRVLAACTRPGGDVVISTGTLDEPAWHMAGGAYWYCAIPEHISFIDQAWLESAAKNLGLTLTHVDRFHYWEDPLNERAAMQASFMSNVHRSKRKQSLVRWLPGRWGRMAPRHIYGRPGLFADHIVANFKVGPV